jgi:rhamnose utilization protein RhaD (predicted bifunctional aldolase and dehydrogenase)
VLIELDHVIRTKGFPLVLQGLRSLIADKSSDKQLQEYLENQVNKFTQDYHTYFQNQNQQSAVKKVELDPYPRVLLIEDVGLVTAGMTQKEASIAADIYEHTIDTIIGIIHNLYHNICN